MLAISFLFVFFSLDTEFVKPKCLDFLKSIVSHKFEKLLNNAHLSFAYAANFYFQTLTLFVVVVAKYLSAHLKFSMRLQWEAKNLNLYVYI